MCLGIPYSKEEQDKIRKAAQKRGYIRVYKVVKSRRSRFIACCQQTKFKAGVQRAQGLKSPYAHSAGFHGFRDLESTRMWQNELEIIIQCLAKAEWIIDVGRFGEEETIRLTHLCFPKFPNTKVTVKDFKEQYKKWKKNGGK